MCVGYDSTVHMYFSQAVVTFDASAQNPSVSLKDSNGHTIGFAQESPGKWVATTVFGAISAAAVQMCDQSAPRNQATITVKAGSQSQDIQFNGCANGQPSDNDFIRTYNADQITGSAQPTAGVIQAFLGVDLGSPSTTDPNSQYVALQKSGIMNISLSGGPSAQTGNNSSGWFSVSPAGVLNITGVKPGKYSLDISYTHQDPVKGGIQFSIKIPDFLVLAGTTKALPGDQFNANNLAYYDQKGNYAAKSVTTTQTPAKETCNVSGIGWIVCPLASFIGKITDAVYAMIETMMVYTVPDALGDNPLKTIWSNILGIANVAFIIAFFAVIFSQATSVGISNYGIKKMMPRMIAAAILVNLSYYICIFAIDISNVIGQGIDGLILSALPNSKAVLQQVHWETAITGALALGVGVGFASTLGPAIVAAALSFAVPALLAVLVTLLVLVARWALLTILIVLSPLAFVAFILPNTEKLFNRWREFFVTMLVFYPLVAILFAGSKAAAYVLLLQ